MPSTEPVRVTIFNRTYSFAPTVDPNQIVDSACGVDELMTRIAAGPKNIDSTQIAVLACLELYDELRMLKRDLEDFKSRVASKAQQYTLLLDEAIGGSANPQ
jgi:cell division protein ZapA (FtsZ GTPase activity inhibitor)